MCNLKPVIDKRDRPAHCLFRISVLARLVLLPAVSGCLVWLSASSVSAASELNLNFIHGADKQHAPAILKEGTSFPPGQYVVDIFFNNQRTARQILTITPAEAGMATGKEPVAEIVRGELMPDGVKVSRNLLRKHCVFCSNRYPGPQTTGGG